MPGNVGRLAALLAAAGRRVLGPRAASQREVASAFESVGHAFATLDPRWRFTHLNRRAEAVLGGTREQLVGRTLWDVFPEARGTPFHDALTSAAATGRPARLEYFHARLDSWFEVHLQATAGGVAASFEDVTDRKRTEQRLATQYAVTRILADANDDHEASARILEAIGTGIGWGFGALWRVDRIAQLLDCVAVWQAAGAAAPAFVAATRSYRFPPGIGLPGRVWQDARAQWIPDVVEDANFPRARDAAHDGLHGAFAFPILLGGEVYGVIEFFSHQIRSPDETLLMEVAAIGSQIGQFIERTRAQAALRRSEERLRLAVEAGVMGTFDWDVASGEIVWSKTMERLHGLAPDTFGRTLDAVLACVHPEEREGLSARIERNLASGPGDALEYRTRWPDGTERCISAKAAIVRDAVGKPHRVTGVATDVTERKRLEEAQARVLSVEQTANRVKDEFLATLSHELRTPLSAILGWTRILRTQRLDEAATARGLETIERNTRLQTQLIEDLLDVSRIITGKLRLELQPVDLPVVVEAAVDTIRPAAEAKNLRLDLELETAVGLVAGDAARLQQVVWNLLSNAIKFTPRGGRIVVRLGRGGAEAVLRLTDTGKGIPADFLPHIFERFRQADSSSTRTQGGLGLGLAIVHHLVGLHRGSIRAESAGDGVGTTFTIHLPLLPLQADAAEMVALRPLPAFETAPSLAGLSILVVDDDPDARDSLALVLEAQGATVTAAASAPEALAALATRWPDVLVSDLAMPGMDGYGLLAQVRALPAHGERCVPALALSAYAREEDRRRALAAGFAMHVAKPVDPVRLAEAIARIADRSGEGRRGERGSPRRGGRGETTSSRSRS